MAEDRVEDKVPLHSPEGQGMLDETASRQMLLVRLFKEQENKAFCAIHSAALVMSARYLGQKFPEPSSHSDCELPDDVPYREDNMFSFEETKGVLDYVECDAVGATMPQLSDLLRAHGLPVRKVHVDESSAEEFRTLASEALSAADSQRAVIVNYDERDLGQDDFVRGHFSPLAAYHAPADRFLLLDTYFDTVDCWVRTEDLFRCMKTQDQDAGEAGMYRGFMIVG